MSFCYNKEEERLLASETFDPLLRREKWALYPIKNESIFALAKQAVASFWTVEELDFAGDAADIRRLSKEEGNALLTVLSFFAQADGLVMENVNTNYISRVGAPEAQYFYAMQMAMEAIHSEAYSLMLDLYVSQEDERENVLRRVQTLPSVQRKNEWAQKWIASGRPVAVLLVASCCVEGIFFSSSFALIFYFRKRGLLPGLSQANDFIARDEGLHVRFGAELLKQLSVPPSKDLVRSVFNEAVQIEKEFASEMLGIEDRLVGFSHKDLCAHVEAMADMVLILCGMEPMYGTTSPFDFMQMQSLPGRANFFEKRPSEYTKAATSSKPLTDSSFSLVVNF